jgi:hypothetical protein
MLEVGERYVSPRTGTWVKIAERSGGNLTFERGFAPETGRADPHLHEDLTQTWEGLSLPCRPRSGGSRLQRLPQR